MVLRIRRDTYDITFKETLSYKGDRSKEVQYGVIRTRIEVGTGTMAFLKEGDDLFAGNNPGRQRDREKKNKQTKININK